MKECKSCGEEKDVLDFYLIPDGDDRYQVSCLICRRAGKDMYGIQDEDSEDVVYE